MKNIVGSLTDKSENQIENAHKNSHRNERIYCGLTNFKQFQVSQLQNNDIITNLQVKLKSE